ncbi:zinc finger protein 385D-like [Syngnathoides biaculeatus]|uniref:zinc finger protein 385D-like n=1 Tax=Syngnathoides biaculeatus TaxID=300417 RepID=UPI002ADD6769|nr:zinc finger protein 385D-like [Syngnathoides biaculeatus]
MKTAVSSSYSVCVVCNLQMTSAAQAQLHLNARSHLRRLRNIKAQAPGGGPPVLFPQASRLQTANHNSPPLSSNSDNPSGMSALTLQCGNWIKRKQSGSSSLFLTSSSSVFVTLSEEWILAGFPQPRPKTAFCSPREHWQFEVYPMHKDHLSVFFRFTSCSIHNSGKMDGRKHWGANNTRLNNYNAMKNFEFTRTTSAPLGSGSSRYNIDVSFQRFPKDTHGGCPRPNNINTVEGFCCCPAHEGRMCPTLAAALPGLIGGAGGQSGIMMKPFLPFPVDNTAAPPALPPIFPNFNMMDPVQKAVIKHTFGGVAKTSQRKQPIKCSVCQLRFNSDSQAQAHYQGSRHAKKVKMQKNNDDNKLSINTHANNTGGAPPVALGTNQNTDNQVSLGSKRSSAPAPLPLPQESPPTSEWETEQAKKLLYCSLCKVSVNSVMQLHAHNSGTKHKTMLDARSSSGSIKAFPRAGVKVKSSPGALAGPPLKGSGLQNKTFQCQTCNVHVNSEIQLKQHISSRRHKDRVAGKPIKPKFNKSQHMEMTRPPLSSSIVPSSDWSSSSFLHPAPGPIRASQGSSILFSPY